jgi:DNA-directed RNA polymerase specialized sigma24 family protein
VSDPSFSDFVAERSTHLLRTAYLLTNDHGAARDLLQTALIATHRHWDQLTDPTGYARRELVRAATDWRRLLRLGDLLAESPLMAGTTGLPGFGTGARTDPGPRTELTTALAALPPRLRAALVLRYGADLTEAVTADALGTSMEETRGALLLALERLRELVPGDDALDGRLRTELAVRVADLTADPEQAVALALDGARDRRHHLLGLAALVGFVVLVVVVVALTV